MRCPKCQFDNREKARFCKKCGTKLELSCPSCGHASQPDSVFCDQCGERLGAIAEKEDMVPEGGGERKQVTVLFSDLSGYTAMSEKLDPEEVKETMSRIFGEIARVVTKYEGFIEKFVGDAVMALFGVPKVHEDDAVRAIRAAKEIHTLVGAMSPQLEDRVGEPLSMHTGINTGLVVTGAVDLEKGSHGVSGDTVNLASRLCGLARADEIVVGPETHRQTEGYFTFEALEPATVKGKAEPIRIYKALSPREKPYTIHGFRGLRSELIGRTAEMDQLREAAERLQTGKGTIFAICGGAGTGKSRLVEEFKATLDLNEIEWREGHAYAYSQNIPYFPLIDLLNRAWSIEEGDPAETVRHKVESGVENLIAEKEGIVPYIGSLYALSYPEIEGVSPEFWKSRLQQAIQAVLGALTQRSPTVICLEDLQWADPSSVDLLRFILSEFRYPAVFLFVYRPPFSLFTSHQLSGLGMTYQEIQLVDLSPSDTQEMIESLLKTRTIPIELKRFIQEKVEGNPFYLEEVINALIESETLARDNGGWKVARPIGEPDIPKTVQGVISARLDHLEREMKRILQEASVIGRAFLLKILKKVTELRDQLDRSLNHLERLDLIRTRSIQPELEYMFKHALTQEVVYNGLLKKERQEIHERIGLVMEELFGDRLSEFYETLAFHFRQGHSTQKAVDYLIKSGEKSLKRYAVDESHEYFKEAYQILTREPAKTKEELESLVDLLMKWAYVFYYRGDVNGCTDLFVRHEDLAESLDDKARLGMFYAWFGFTLWAGEKLQGSYEYLSRALKLGEEIENQHLVGYACTWLSWVYAELGRLDEAILFGKRAQEISWLFPADHYLYFKSLAGINYAYMYKGEIKKTLESGKALLDFGQRHSNVQSQVLGYAGIGYSHLTAGDFAAAIECFEKGGQIAVDPMYSMASRFVLGFTHLQNGHFREAENNFQEVVDFNQRFGIEWIGTSSSFFLGVVAIAKGDLRRGLKILQDGNRTWRKNQRRWCVAVSEYVLGKVYAQMVEGAAPISLPKMAKNIDVVLKNVPFASKKAEAHFNEAIKEAKEIGAKAVLGQVYLDLGLLHKAKGRNDQARQNIAEAARLLEQCGAEAYLRQAKEALENLDKQRR